MSDQNKRVFFPNMAWSEIHWSETLKCSCLRNGVVCGFFFNAFTTLCNASISMSSSLTRNVNERQPKRQCGGGGGGDYWIESKGRMFSVSVNLILGTQPLFLMMLQRVEGTRQEYNSWPPDPVPFASCLRPVTVISNIVSLALCSIKAKNVLPLSSWLEEKINKECKICWRR